jgi:hypothetical protein
MAKIPVMTITVHHHHTHLKFSYISVCVFNLILAIEMTNCNTTFYPTLCGSSIKLYNCKSHYIIKKLLIV